MTDLSSMEELMAGLAARDPDAANAIVQKNFERIAAVVKKRIGPRYWRLIDEHSVAQSAIWAAVQRLEKNDVKIATQQELWNLLNCIALRKLANRIRRFKTQRRSVEREQGLADVNERDLERVQDSPEASVVLDDLLVNLLQGYSEPERQAIGMSLFGHPVADIAAEIGKSERFVIRTRTHFRKRLELERQKDE